MNWKRFSLRRLLVALSDIALPRPSSVKFLERATLADFRTRVKPAQEHLPNTASLFDYRNPLVKTAVWEIKFRGNQSITKLAGQLIYEHLLEELGDHTMFAGESKLVLIPVPLAPKRLLERGFNQAERIAQIIVEIDTHHQLSLSTAVRRIRETPSQTHSLNRTTRLQNLRGAFAVTDRKEIANKNVIVIDDVTTTGATINEMRKVLLEAGASSVTGLTLAH